MIPKIIADDLMKCAYPDWIPAGGVKTYLRGPAQQLKEQLDAGILTKDNVRISELIERLLSLSDRFAQTQQSNKGNEYEKAETRLHCGWAAYQTGDKKEATEHLEKAALLYSPNHHCQAVANWMVGCIYWQLPTKINEAIFRWEMACEGFERCQERESKQKGEWYQMRMDGIKLALEWAIAGVPDQEFPEEAWIKLKDFSSKAYGATLPGATTKFAPNQSQKDGTRRYATSTMKAWPVIGIIPAGTPTDVLPPEEDEVGIETIELRNGESYKLISLRGERLINVSQSKVYYVLRVMGNSMNTATPEIKSGDYVLMVKQKHAEVGDIVAAILPGIDRYATLKRYFYENGKIILKPESNDPEFQKPIPTPSGFEVRGVAIALLQLVDE